MLCYRSSSTNQLPESNRCPLCLETLGFRGKFIKQGPNITTSLGLEPEHERFGSFLTRKFNYFLIFILVSDGTMSERYFN